MSNWKQCLRSSSMATDNQGDVGSLTLAVLQAFKADCVVGPLQKIFQSTIAPLAEAHRQTNDLNVALRYQIAERDAWIEKLEGSVTDLELRNDDLVQQGCKGSICILGLPESDEGTLQEKVLRLCLQSFLWTLNSCTRLESLQPNPCPVSNNQPRAVLTLLLLNVHLAALPLHRLQPGLPLSSSPAAGRRDGSWTINWTWRTILVPCRTELQLRCI